MDSEDLLHGLAILITRPAAQAASFAQRIQESGGRPLVLPVIAIAPPEDELPLIDAARNLAVYDWVLFTSANAVESFMARVPEEGRARAVACVGEATARALEERHVAVDLKPEEFNADGLLTSLIERLGDDLSNVRFLMPRAAEGRDILPEGLRRHGAQVDLVTAYRTVASTEGREQLLEWLQTGGIDVLTFASPSAVECFDHLVADSPAAALARTLPTMCIGPVTARRARGLEYNVVAVAARADVEAMVTAVALAVPYGPNPPLEQV